MVIDDQTGKVYGGGTYNKCGSNHKTQEKNYVLDLAKNSIDEEKIVDQKKIML